MHSNIYTIIDYGCRSLTELANNSLYTVQLGTNFLNEDCSKLLTCVTTEEGPILSEQTQPTCNNGDCKAVDGQYQCVCKDGFVLVDGTCRPEGIYVY